jgi:predicted nucleic acid-binding protein
MILVDTSAWVEFLRDTDSIACRRVDALLSEDIAVCDPIRMEVLAGARSEAHLHDLRALLARARVLPTEPRHYEMASALYRNARSSSVTVRRLIDCLIAAVAIDHDVPLLHADRGFDGLARTSALRVDAS